jgi:predicted MFS family arabinose efflux permease
MKSLRADIRKTAVIYPAAFMMSFAQSSQALGVVFFMKQHFGVSGLDVGNYFAVQWTAYLLGCQFLRPLTERLLPRVTCAVSLFALATLMGIMALSTSLTTVIVCGGLIGLTIAMFWPPLMGWMALRLEGEELGRTTGRYNMSWSSGVLVGLPMAGFVSEVSPVLVLVISGSVWLLNATMVTGAALVLPRIRADRDRPRDARGRPDSSEHSTRLRYAARVGLFGSACAMGAVSFVFPYIANTDFALREGVIGLLRLVLQIAITAGFALLGRFAFWHYRAAPMLLAQAVLMGLLVLLVRLATPLPIGAVFFVFGACFATAYAYSIFHGAAGASNRAARMAMHESTLSAGFLVGSLAGGLVYDTWGVAAFYLLFAGFLAAVLPAQGALAAWGKKKDREHQALLREPDPTSDAAK